MSDTGMFIEASSGLSSLCFSCLCFLIIAVVIYAIFKGQRTVYTTGATLGKALLASPEATKAAGELGQAFLAQRQLTPGSTASATSSLPGYSVAEAVQPSQELPQMIYQAPKGPEPVLYPGLPPQ